MRKIPDGCRIERVGRLTRILRRIDGGIRRGIHDPLRRVRGNRAPHLFRVRDVQICMRKRSDGSSRGRQRAECATDLTASSRQKDSHAKAPASRGRLAHAARSERIDVCFLRTSPWASSHARGVSSSSVGIAAAEQFMRICLIPSRVTEFYNRLGRLLRHQLLASPAVSVVTRMLAPPSPASCTFGSCSSDFNTSRAPRSSISAAFLRSTG